MSFLPRITLFRAEGLVPVPKTGVESLIQRLGGAGLGLMVSFIAMYLYTCIGYLQPSQATNQRVVSLIYSPLANVHLFSIDQATIIHPVISIAFKPPLYSPAINMYFVYKRRNISN